METFFPTASGYAGFFFVGFRKDAGETQRTGTVVLKRTYDVDPLAGTFTPASNPLPAFLQDVPFNTSDSILTLRYEHDLASFKPEGDVVVLGFAEAGPCAVRVNGATRLQRTVLSALEKALLGWEPRGDAARLGQAGTQPPPEGQSLPPDFDNRFYNGYLRAARHLAASPFLAANAEVEIDRNGVVDYAFTLPSDTASAAYFFHAGVMPDEEKCWQRVPVAMNLDTLVAEPESDRCYVVWRGVWDFDAPGGAFDEQAAHLYRRLVVEASPENQ